jgi:hypothetical protein
LLMVVLQESGPGLLPRSEKSCTANAAEIN